MNVRTNWPKKKRQEDYVDKYIFICLDTVDIRLNQQFDHFFPEYLRAIWREYNWRDLAAFFEHTFASMKILLNIFKVTNSGASLKRICLKEITKQDIF